MERWLSFLMKLLIGGLLMLAFVGLWGVGLSLSDVSNFKQTVDATIEREGGLTPKALKELSTYAKEHTHGQYVLKSAQEGQVVPYGQVVAYELICSYRTPFLKSPFYRQVIKGQAVSQVRGEGDSG